MFVVLMRFSDNKSRASEFMDDHNKWIKQGISDGVFLLVGSLQPGLGGSIIAHDLSLSDLEFRLKKDPFVEENIVSTEVLEIEPKLASERLSFLLE